MKISFGENLKRLRKNANLTQNEVAEKLFVSHQSVSKWENNITLPSIAFCILLVQILECTINDLLMIEDED